MPPLFVSFCEKVKFFSAKVKISCYKEGVKTKGVDIMFEKETAERMFMDNLKRSFEATQKEEYAKKVEVLSRKYESAAAALFNAQENLTAATEYMSASEIADGKLDVHIQSVRTYFWRMEKIVTQIATIKEMVGGGDNETRK